MRQSGVVVHDYGESCVFVFKNHGKNNCDSGKMVIVVQMS